MSDFQRYLKKAAKSKDVKAAEKGEQAEGLRESLRAGRGDVVKGARKLGLKKEGLDAALRGAKCPAGKGMKKGK